MRTIPTSSSAASMLWRGRIYSPLPFVRSLSGTRINTGVWGTAPFPSVYRTDVHPFAVPAALASWRRSRPCAASLGAGGSRWSPTRSTAALLLGGGRSSDGGDNRPLRRLRAALRSRGLRARPHRLAAAASRADRVAALRAAARARHGTPARDVSPPRWSRPDTSPACRGRRRVPSLARFRALGAAAARRQRRRGLSGAKPGRAHDTPADRARRLAARGPARRSIDVDDGWSRERDVSVSVGRWGWLDLRALIEEHAGGTRAAARGDAAAPEHSSARCCPVAGASCRRGHQRGASRLRWPSSASLGAWRCRSPAARPSGRRRGRRGGRSRARPVTRARGG